jgi:hypothetical protein
VIETNWFLPTEPPVRPGVYKTKHRGSDGAVYEGYSKWVGKFWGATRESARAASTTKYPSSQQSKAWCGLTEERK